MDKTYKQYIKDTATTLAFIVNKNTTASPPLINIKSFALKAIKNYCAFRLKYMTNKNITDVEAKLITNAIKAGIKIAVKKYDVQLENDDIDKAVDYILPELLIIIQEQRVQIFTKLLEITDNAG